MGNKESSTTVLIGNKLCGCNCTENKKERISEANLDKRKTKGKSLTLEPNVKKGTDTDFKLNALDRIENSKPNLFNENYMISPRELDNDNANQSTQSPSASNSAITKKKEYLDGSIYFGTLVNDLKHGKGKLALPGETFYDGDFENDLYHGFGIMTHSNGTVYKGEFFKGMKSGRGTLSNANSLDGQFIYEGLWCKNMKNGLGKEFYSDLSFYEGYFLDNMKHVHGKLVKANGCYYEGEFQCDKMKGMVGCLI